MELEIISGIVEHVTFHNVENGYSVLKVNPDENDYAQNPNGTLTVVGNFPDALAVGDSADFEGYWIENPKFGTQFKVMGYKRLKRQAPQVQAQASLWGNAAANPPLVGESTLYGTIARITYYNEDNGWGVVKISPQGDDYPDEAMSYDGLISVIGVMPELVEGEAAEFAGKWVNNAQYGKQFKCEAVIPIAPQNKQGIIRYIADTVFGIGDVTATRIYNHFGDDALEILDLNPERIREVGLKSNLEENFITTWTQNRTLRQIMIHLQSYGITSRLAKKIFDEYHAATLQVVQTNPYQLADDVHGIGFKKADEIARSMGIAPDARERLRAGLVYTLSQMTNEGHTFTPRAELIERAMELLNIGDFEVDLDAEVREQVLAKKLWSQTLHHHGEKTDAIYLPLYYHSESGAAEKLRIMANGRSKMQFRMQDTGWPQYLHELSAQNNVNLSAQQQSAVTAALSSKLSVLTGGPGTGKTTTLQMVINALDKEKFSYHLASPTGRAAKRLQEATGRAARTIHRLLGWDPANGGFEHDEDNPLDVDMVIIDEASMIDLLLFYGLLKALNPSTHLMLVGDVDQLPSVGAGNVLNDVMNSGIAQVTRLDQIFRQDDASHIVVNAHRINNGEMPVTDNNSKDFFFFNVSEPVEAAEMVVDIVVNRLAKKLGNYDRINDIQVIARWSQCLESGTAKRTQQRSIPCPKALRRAHLAQR